MSSGYGVDSPELDLSLYVSSFTGSQKDMLNSAPCVAGTKVEDWKITQEPAAERYAA